MSYADAGVSIAEGDRFVDFIRTQAKGIGGFSGLFPINVRSMKRPQLVAGTDGVGTKLRIAQLMNRHDTIGIDLVAMVVNDLIVCGATPLFFLDYYACGKLRQSESRDLLTGILAGCAQGRMTLLGGETAEMPGLYAADEYDLAGFGVGLVDAAAVIDGRNVRAGDVVVGFASSGVHSNGYSLARKALKVTSKKDLSRKVAALGSTVGECLLTPTRIYVDLVNAIRAAKVDVHAYAHITGGGLAGNLVRVLPPNVRAVLLKDTWDVPPIFDLIAKSGPVDEAEMFRAFNMGIGFVAVVPAAALATTLRAAKKVGVAACEIGTILRHKGAPVVTMSQASQFGLVGRARMAAERSK